MRKKITFIIIFLILFLACPIPYGYGVNPVPASDGVGSSEARNELPRSKLRGILAGSASSFLAPSSVQQAGRFSALRNKRNPSNIFSQQTNKLLPEPQASLLNGILWGEQRRMPRDFYEGLRRTGTLHVIALSGMNITILVNLLAKITLVLGRKKSIFLSLATIVIFIWFVGASPSVIRAGIMGGLTLLSVYFGRQNLSLLSLILSASIMLIFRPGWITDISFQLSFLATLGIILLVPYAQTRGKKGNLITEFLYEGKENLRVSLAAQIFTLPIIFYNFRQVSIVSPLTNVLVLWLVQPIMILGFFLSLAVVVYQPLAYPLAWITWAPLTYFIEVVKLTARLPLTQITF